MKPIVLVFGGQSNRHVHVPRELFDSCAVFRSHLEACDEALETIGYPRIILAIFDSAERASALTLQTMQFALQYSYARSWVDCGPPADCLLGHSLGELVALAVSGYLSLEDGLRLVCGRASLIDRKWGDDPGGMISVETDHRTVKAICHHVEALDPSYQLEIAYHNGRRSYVLVGSSAEVSALLIVLNKHFTSIRFKQLNITHRFHLKLTQPILDNLQNLASSLSFNIPEIPLERCKDTPVNEPLTAKDLVEHY